ncbi:MAG: MAPEG family protein [Steroidobacteraceae bacterium]
MAILWPAFALFALTMIVVLRLARMRFAAASAGRVDPRFYKSFRGDGEPEEVAVVSRHLINLYEMPTLFYAGTAIAFAAGQASALLVSLGWAYVAFRLAHSAIHLSTNKVRWRFRAFAASWLVLLAYWIVLGVELTAAGGALAAAG